MGKSFFIVCFLGLMCCIDSREGITILRNPDPQSVCAGKPVSFTWRYNAATRHFQYIYWRHAATAASGSQVMAELLLAEAKPKFTPTEGYKGRLENITESLQTVDGGEVTLTITETILTDAGNIYMDVADTSGKENRGTGVLTVMTAPTLTPGQTELSLERVVHNMTTTLIHCTNIQDAGSPPAQVSIRKSVPGHEDSISLVPVVNGEGKQAFFGQDRFGTFKCALEGPAAACTESPVQSASRGFFSKPGAPRLESIQARATSAKVNFQAGFHGGTKVNFTAKYQMQGEEKWTDALVTVGHINEGQPGSLEIQGLLPLTNYSVYVIATNAMGFKQSNEESFETKGSDGLSSGAIIGIVIGVIGGAGIAAIVGFVCWKKQGKKEKSSLEEMEKMNKSPVAV